MNEKNKLTLIKELRERTQAPLLDCKEALEASGDDLEKAIEYLRKKGALIAAKKVSRVTSEGLVGGYVNPQGNLGVLLELNCETDFVAKTEKFNNLLHELIMEVASAEPGYSDPKDLLPENITNAIAVLGENIRVSRFVRYKLGELQRQQAVDKPVFGLIGTYIHSGGKIGVILELNCSEPHIVELPEFKSLLHELALQIAALAPEYISRKDIPEEILEREREIYRSLVLKEGKPISVVDKIVEGKLNKFYQEVCLLDQPWIRDEKISIGSYISKISSQSGAEIWVSRFNRFKVGEIKS